MKTVFISIPWFAPAFKAGGPIQSIHNLVSVPNQNIQYKIFCSNKDVDHACLTGIQTNKWIKFNDNTEVWYDSTGFSFLNLRKEAINCNPDIIYLIGIYSLNYNLLPLFLSKSNKIILSTRGMLHSGALMQKKIKKSIYIFLLKIFKIKDRVHFHATNELESNSIKNVFGNNIHVHIATNYFRQIGLKYANNKIHGKLKLITIALISPIKNHLLVLNSLLLCKDEIEYHIIGAIKDKSYWDNCLNQISKMPKNIQVFYHGEIPPAEVKLFLNNSPVLIMLSESENYGHSIIECLSAGVPVIASKNTPWNNLKDYYAGSNVPLDEEVIKNEICKFVNMNAIEYDNYSTGAKIYSEKHIDFKLINHQYQKLFNTIND